MVQTLVHSGPIEAIKMSTLLPQREQRDLRKLQQVMDPVELALTHTAVSHDPAPRRLQAIGGRLLDCDIEIGCCSKYMRHSHYCLAVTLYLLSGICIDLKELGLKNAMKVN